MESSKKRGQNKEADDLIHGEVSTQLRGPWFGMLYIYDEHEVSVVTQEWRLVRQRMFTSSFLSVGGVREHLSYV